MTEVVPMTKCSRCRRAGHQARDCKVIPFLKPAAPAGSTATSVCRRCKLPGHWARDCKVPSWKLGKREEDDDASSVVSTAASSTIQKGTRTFPCATCGDLDHGAAQCKNMLCYECNERGHFSSACPQRAERLAREHDAYKKREARRREATERQQRRKEEDADKSRQACAVVAAARRVDSPPTPETRPAPELGSSALFPALGVAKPGPALRRPETKYADLD